MTSFVKRTRALRGTGVFPARPSKQNVRFASSSCQCDGAPIDLITCTCDHVTELADQIYQYAERSEFVITQDEGKIGCMPNVANILRIEIARVARKEIRSEIDGLRSASNKYRSDIAALKRQLSLLERELRRKSRLNEHLDVSTSGETAEIRHRFSAKGLASHRKRLGLSAEALGKLIGVSGLSIYHWESGKSRPRSQYLPAIAALRTLGTKQAQEVLATR
jgi:DNA-binding transcriptional regulator YiaG